MIYELRIYQCVPGRLPVLLKRFEDHTLKIWEKHGIRQARLLDRADRRQQQ
jgi:NIPSNAP